MKKAAVLPLLLICLASCVGSPVGSPSEPSREPASQDLAAARTMNHLVWKDLRHNFFTTSGGLAHIIKTNAGYPVMWNGALWERSIMSLLLNDEARARVDSDLTDLVKSDWQWFKSTYSSQERANCSTGTDDAAWIALSLIGIYEITSDGAALDDAKNQLKCTYSRFAAPDDSAHGLWYDDNHRVTSIYEAGLALAAWDIYKITGDESYYALVEKTRKWIERDLGRPDGLYFVEYDPRANKALLTEDPDGTGASFIAGNMAMAILYARLFDKTHDDKMRQKAVAIARGIATKQVSGEGILVNGRDANTDGAFAVRFAMEVMPLKNAPGKLAYAFKKTAETLVNTMRTGDGYYAPDWSGGNGWSSRGYAAKKIIISAQAGSIALANWILQKQVSAGTIAPDHMLMGTIDSVSESGIDGWACMRATSQSIPVDIYIGGPFGQGGVNIDRITANVESEDAIAQACNAHGHRYRFHRDWQPGEREGQTGKAVYIYGIGKDARENLLLTGSGTLKVH